IEDSSPKPRHTVTENVDSDHESSFVFHKFLTSAAHPSCGPPCQIGMATLSAVRLRKVFVGLVVVTSVGLALTTLTPDGTGNETARKKSLLAESNVPVPVRAVLER